MRLNVAAAAAACAVVLAFAFQALTVRYNYHGDWTALYCVGDRQPQPEEIPPAYHFAGSWGYDGQFYRIIAHDPLNRRGLARYVDNPGYRYDRLLLPGLAWLLAFGDDARIDGAYIFCNLVFVFLGSWWLARFGTPYGWPPRWCALGFLAVPATMISLDRLTVDLAMAALCLGAIAARRNSLESWFILAAGALCRETGLLLIAAACFVELRERHWKNLMVTASAAGPAACWHFWVMTHLPPVNAAYLSAVPLAGFIERLFHPPPYPFPFAISALATVLDYVSLAGVGLSLWGLWAMRRRLADYPELILCALPVLFVANPDVWSDAYAFGRAMSPFFLLIAARGAANGRWWMAAPLAMIDLRAGLQIGSQLLGIAKGLVT